MLLPIKPVCKKDKVRRDGTSLIFIQYCFNSDKRILLNTDIAIPPAYWNRKRLGISPELPLIFGKSCELNQRLEKLLRLVQDMASFALNNKLTDPCTFLKNSFKPDFDLEQLEQKAVEIKVQTVNLDVFYQIDDYMMSRSKHVTHKMLNVYRNMRDTLLAFQAYRKRPITFDSFDFNFYEEFVAYMLYEHVQRRRKKIIKGFRISTAGKTIKQLRIFLRNRMRKKIIPPINLEDFKILDEETDAVYLTWNEIIQIYQTDLSGHPHLGKYRDLLVFGCLTGLRFSDFTTIKPIDVRNGMLYKKQAKSDRWVVIPLREEAKSIFENNLKTNIPQIENGVFNRYIKEVAKVAGISQLIRFSHKKGNKDIVTIKSKYDWITSHTCRRSFCTNEFLAGTPVDLIMKISGHKSLRDFYKYIRITPEEAGQKIRDIWLNRGDMSFSKESNEPSPRATI